MDSPEVGDASMQGQGVGGGRDAGSGAGTGAFGPNAWLVEDMYERYQADPSSVSASWQEFFADYRPSTGSAPTAAAVVQPPTTTAVPPAAATPAAAGGAVEGAT